MRRRVSRSDARFLSLLIAAGCGGAVSAEVTPQGDGAPSSSVAPRVDAGDGAVGSTPPEAGLPDAPLLDDRGSPPALSEDGSAPEGADSLADGPSPPADAPADSVDGQVDGSILDASPLERCLAYCESLPHADASTCAQVCGGPPRP